MPYHVHNEYGHLQQVVLATVAHYRVTEPVNAIQDKYYTSTPPILAKLLEEQNEFTQLLSSHNIQILWATPKPECPLQLNTRDVATVIGDTLVIGRMRFPIRRGEVEGLKDILDDKTKIISMDENGFLECGDIVIDYPSIYVGIGERTDDAGVNFLETHFGRNWEVIPLSLREGILHLDVVFNVISSDTILLFAEAFTSAALSYFERRYKHLILVDTTEQFDLATNVFVLGHGKLVADRRNTRVARLLREKGNEVVELDFEHTSRIGGSFRCATLPLIRT